MLNSFKKNIVANFIGRFWGVISNFLFVPIYINFLGLESYSIISFTLVIHGIITIMDAGLTSTLSREFASSQNSFSEKYSIFKTLESSYFVISILAILIIALSSNLIANKWLNINELYPAQVSYYIRIISIEIGLRFLVQFYTGGLIGLEKQVKSNIYQVVWGITRNGLVLVPLFFIPTLEIFFLWQTIVTLIYVFIIRFELISFFSGKSVISYFSIPKIEKSILLRVWRFAGGMMLISIVAAINTQMDKIALSKLLSIEILGLYTIAFSLSTGLNLLCRPFSMASLPRMTAYITGNKQYEAQQLFNKVNIIIAIIIFSFMSSMIIFAKDLIWIWTNDISLADHSYIFLPYIVVGSSFLAMQEMPFNIVIANGFTKYNNILGISSLFITLPGYWILTKIYGGIGAAITFSFVQILMTIVYLYLVNRKFIKLPIFKLYAHSFIIPISISLIVTLLFSKYLEFENTRLMTFFKIGITITTAMVINILVLIPLEDIKRELFILKQKISK